MRLPCLVRGGYGKGVPSYFENSQTFIRRSCVYGERVDTGFEFVGESLVDQTMAGDPALPPERVSYNIDPEMRFSTRPMSGVACMLMGFVEHLQSQRSEGVS